MGARDQLRTIASAHSLACASVLSLEELDAALRTWALDTPPRLEDAGDTHSLALAAANYDLVGRGPAAVAVSGRRLLTKGPTMNRSFRITLTSLVALLAAVTLTAFALPAIDMFIKFDAKGPNNDGTLTTDFKAAANLVRSGGGERDQGRRSALIARRSSIAW
jgi:hypothetical protein